MNDDTISRQAAINTALRAISDLQGKDSIRDEYIISEMKEIPSAEQYGRWEHSWGDEWCCSACGHVITTEGSWERPWQKYCEECGAKMTREDEEMSKVSEMEMAYAEFLND